jgi:hypothetical protein
VPWKQHEPHLGRPAGFEERTAGQPVAVVRAAAERPLPADQQGAVLGAPRAPGRHQRAAGDLVPGREDLLRAVSRQVAAHQVAGHPDPGAPAGRRVRGCQRAQRGDHLGRPGLGATQLGRQPHAEDPGGPQRGDDVVRQPACGLDLRAAPREHPTGGVEPVCHGRHGPSLAGTPGTGRVAVSPAGDKGLRCYVA